MILVFSICSNNYLAQAITLGDTLQEFAPEYKFVICLVDRKNADIDYESIRYDILEVENIGVPYFDEMVMRYNIVELNTAFKPYFFQYFFTNTKADSIIYLDPDIQVFSSFSVLEKELRTSDIVITPHFTTPLNDDKWQAEEDFLNSGLYNLGFIAINKSDTGSEMIKWWADRLRNKAYINYCKGLFTDQIWINFVPLFFPRVKILTDSGYNVAYWNLHERIISNTNGTYTINTNYPLVFFHYASFRPLNPGIISSGQKRFTFEDRPDIEPLFQKYCELVFKNNYKRFVEYKCFYVEARETLEKEQLLEKIRMVPFYKKVIGRVIREIIKRMKLVMDYNTL
jgi:hypothetical protein